MSRLSELFHILDLMNQQKLELNEKQFTVLTMWFKYLQDLTYSSCQGE